MNRNIVITAGMIVLVFICAAAIEPRQRQKEFKNLQVLPKDISEKELLRIMEEECNKGLGITCNYCHAKQVGSTDLDYVSDSKGEKLFARSMMKMTLEINQKYFGAENPKLGDSLMTIRCKTCHKGVQYPSSP